MDGWIKCFRSLIDWEWYDDSNMVHLFLHLLLKANHKDGKWKGIKVKKGQLITGRKALSEETGISEQSVRTCLSKLERTGEITIKPTNKYSLISIQNYANYQQINQQPNQQLTSNQPATNHKQEGKERKEPNITFGVFWDAYGKKVGSRAKCEKKWKALTDEQREKIIRTLPAFKNAISDKQYQPHPLTYLNNERWEDEIVHTPEFRAVV